MKLELNIDEKVKETLVVVSANKIDKEVQNLINYIEYSSEYLIGIVEDKASIIDIGEIIRVYIEDRKTFVVTLKDTYVVKKKLYEVENMVTRNFIKISQSEIANIKFIKNSLTYPFWNYIRNFFPIFKRCRFNKLTSTPYPSNFSYTCIFIFNFISC